MSATNRGAQREPNDKYPTPAWCTELLVPEVVWGDNPTILEPCIGDGSIADVLRPHVASIDWCEIDHGRDFFTHEFHRRRFDFVVTNPPYSIDRQDTARMFVDRSFELANCVIMLLRLNFLGSQKRHEWWQSHRPTAKLILSDRPSFKGKGNDSCEYAWFVWDSTGRQQTGDHWLKRK